MTRPADAPPPVTAALEVSSRAAKLLVAAGTAPLRIERLTASTIPEPTDDPVASLRALLETHPLSARAVGVLFGRDVFTLRALELPSTSPQEMASMLELQLGKLTPYSRAEILFGWSAIGSSREGYTTTLLAIARRALVEGILGALRGGGLEPAWVGVSTEGLEAWWRQTSAPQPATSGQLSALIDVDYASTDCAILRDGRLLFSQSLAIGADQLGHSDEAALRWIGELIRLPRILLHEDLPGRIETAVVTGVTQGVDPLVEQLASQWGAAVTVRDALERAQPTDAVRRQAEAARASFTALVGALGSGRPPTIDLLPPETRLTQALAVRSRRLARCAATLAAILVFVGVLYAERILLLSRYRQDLQARLADIERTSSEVLQQQDLMRRVNAWLGPSGSALELLYAVATAAGPEITVTHLTYRDGQPAAIRGRAASTSAAFEFLEALKAGPFCQEAQARSVEKSRSTGGDTAEFDITCTAGGA